MILIRDAKLDDVPDIARVHVETWRTSYSGIVPQTVLDGLSVDQRQMMWEALLTRHGSTRPTLVAEETPATVSSAGSSGVIGFGLVGPADGRVPDIAGEILLLYILERFQRRDVGRRLFAALIERLRMLGHNSAVTWVFEGSAACPFFEAMGGVAVARTAIDYAGKPVGERAYVWPDLAVLPVSEKG
jgi:GNAT superfamily N-acetyltransferase